MAHSLSAKKRDRQNEVRKQRNVARKSELKTLAKRFLDAVNAKDLDKAKAEFVQLTKRFDQVAAKGTVHRNKAARRKSRLQRQLNTLAKSETTKA
ncbi:MAG: 30S ribosomal protein S20 [Phycisphaerae bacterium]|nr:30S ribosomal protein S20 [Phycisphaerae bacterium]